jgi:hypothetical protein
VSKNPRFVRCPILFEFALRFLFFILFYFVCSCCAVVEQEVKAPERGANHLSLSGSEVKNEESHFLSFVAWTGSTFTFVCCIYSSSH